MTLILNISCLLDRIKPQMRATLYFNNILHFFSFVFSKFVLSWDISIHETKKEDWRYRRLYHGKNCFNVIKLSKYCCYKSNCNLSCYIAQWDIGNLDIPSIKYVRRFEGRGTLSGKLDNSYLQLSLEIIWYYLVKYTSVRVYLCAPCHISIVFLHCDKQTKGRLKPILMLFTLYIQQLLLARELQFTLWFVLHSIRPLLSLAEFNIRT